MRISAIALSAVVLMPACLPAAAHDHATGVVKERMDMMEAMAKRMKAIRARIDGRRDLAGIKAEADAIAVSTPHIIHLFPPVSNRRPSEASASIWQNWPDFERMAEALEAESKKLASVEPRDIDALSAQFRALAAACGACHEKYRTKN
jgi:cytochrome c556